MCGIAGGVFWSGEIARPIAERAVRTMVQKIAHRGPDGQGIYLSTPKSGASGREPYAVLGHTRLAIIDVSEAGSQPMGGHGTDCCITYNGETYNFLDVRARLERQGVTFRSQSDTEVILRGYDAWGIDVVKTLRGMFALGLWDPQRSRLLLARDRLGIKPVYFYRGDGFLLFASEVRALLATDLVPRRLDPTALWQYLGYQSIPAPRTLIEGVHALEPGCWMSIDGEGRETRNRYWNMLDAARTPADLSDAEARRRVGELLRDAVAAHMISDVPVGAFLSGGIDSTAVVALMREAGHIPRTFSVGFDEQQFDESNFAALVARQYHTDHTHVQLTGADLLSQLPSALNALDQPSGDAVNTYVVSGAVRARGIKVALSGLGGDEIFGGYPSFARLTRIADLTRIWAKTPPILRTFTAATIRAIGGSSVQTSKAAAVLETDGSISSMFPLMRQLWSTDQRLALVESSVVAAVGDRDDPYDRLLAEAYADTPASTVFAQISFAEARTYMHDVLLRDTDQMSMAHALEVRVPLIDHELVDAVTAMPDRVKHSNGTPKRLLVEALGGLLPEAIVYRPKQGFVLPFDMWMRGPLRPMCEHRLGEQGLAGRGLFQPATVRQLWQSFLDSGKDVTWSRLWTLVVLDAWLESHALSL